MLEQEGYELMGAAFEVYNTLGHGFLEEVYQQSMEAECSQRRIPYHAQQELVLHYKSIRLTKYYVADLVTYNQIVIELKACRELTQDHTAQLINYLKAAHMSVGYLINFGRPDRLEWKRVIFTQDRKEDFTANLH